jgi:hypothetical protein
VRANAAAEAPNRNAAIWYRRSVIGVLPAGVEVEVVGGGDTGRVVALG